MKNIPFNKPFMVGQELQFIAEAVDSGKISGDGIFTRKCHAYFEGRYGFGRSLLTTSCTDALEMAAILLNIQAGDEVIMPAYTFVSTANAFALRNARIVFADSESLSPNISAADIEALITPSTKAIVVVHYAGVACDMDAILGLGARHGIPVIEDAAQAIDARYKGRPLGGLGALGTFSFHETKNIISGEGGMLAINDAQYERRAEIIREKGTNRAEFFRGEIDKYGWVDIGSSFLPSEIVAAFLYAQLLSLERIQHRRKELWQRYHAALTPLQQQGRLRLPFVPDYSTNNAHMYYLVCANLDERTRLIAHLKQQGIHAVFHYQSLHRSPYFSPSHDGRVLAQCDLYADCLVRLPMFFELEFDDVDRICHEISAFYRAA